MRQVGMSVLSRSIHAAQGRGLLQNVNVIEEKPAASPSNGRGRKSKKEKESATEEVEAVGAVAPLESASPNPFARFLAMQSQFFQAPKEPLPQPAQKSEAHLQGSFNPPLIKENILNRQLSPLPLAAPPQQAISNTGMRPVRTDLQLRSRGEELTTPPFKGMHPIPAAPPIRPPAAARLETGEILPKTDTPNTLLPQFSKPLTTTETAELKLKAASLQIREISSPSKQPSVALAKPTRTDATQRDALYRIPIEPQDKAPSRTVPIPQPEAAAASLQPVVQAQPFSISATPPLFMQPAPFQVQAAKTIETPTPSLPQETTRPLLETSLIQKNPIKETKTLPQPPAALTARNETASLHPSNPALPLHIASLQKSSLPHFTSPTATSADPTARVAPLSFPRNESSVAPRQPIFGSASAKLPTPMPKTGSFSNIAGVVQTVAAPNLAADGFSKPALQPQAEAPAAKLAQAMPEIQKPEPIEEKPPEPEPFAIMYQTPVIIENYFGVGRIG